MMNFSRNYPRVFVRNFADINPWRTFPSKKYPESRRIDPVQDILLACGVKHLSELRKGMTREMLTDPNLHKTLMRLVDSQPNSKLAEVTRAIKHYQDDPMPMTPEQEFDMRNAGVLAREGDILPVNDQIEGFVRSRAEAAAKAARAKK